jgi:hypothetical protein
VVILSAGTGRVARVLYGIQKFGKRYNRALLQQVKGDIAGLHTSFNAKGRERRIAHTNGMRKRETNKRNTETMTIKNGRQASS